MCYLIKVFKQASFFFLAFLFCGPLSFSVEPPQKNPLSEYISQIKSRNEMPVFLVRANAPPNENFPEKKIQADVFCINKGSIEPVFSFNANLKESIYHSIMPKNYPSTIHINWRNGELYVYDSEFKGTQVIDSNLWVKKIESISSSKWLYSIQFLTDPKENFVLNIVELSIKTKEEHDRLLKSGVSESNAIFSDAHEAALILSGSKSLNDLNDVDPKQVCPYTRKIKPNEFLSDGLVVQIEKDISYEIKKGDLGIISNFSSAFRTPEIIYFVTYWSKEGKVRRLSQKGSTYYLFSGAMRSDHKVSLCVDSN